MGIVRKAVASSRSVAEYGYDASTLTLEVAFPPNKSGESALYRYDGVTPDVVLQLEASESFGSAFAALVKEAVKRGDVVCTPLGKIALEPRELDS